MSREALVVGVNVYASTAIPSLSLPAKDASAIAEILARDGGFSVRQLPEIKKDGTLQTSPSLPVSRRSLVLALKRLFSPNSSVPDTALFYFAGHGIFLEDDLVPKGYLVTSDADPQKGNWGLPLTDIHEMLLRSPVNQLIVWLDCCNSGAITEIEFTQADPHNRGRARDICFIAASRSFEEAYEGLEGSHGVLTNALLSGLSPDEYPTGQWITNYSLADSINRAMEIERQQNRIPQRPVFSNFGQSIQLTQGSADFDASRQNLLPNFCPYVGLDAFDIDRAKYFYGRDTLVDQLCAAVNPAISNFLTVLGPSGSGKSSVVRAGLMHQLSLGQKVSGSDRWHLLRIVRPGDDPIQGLASAFVDSELEESDRQQQQQQALEVIYEQADKGLIDLVKRYDAPRVVMVIDQFEEAFTLCQDPDIRQDFFRILMLAVEQSETLCLVIAMRSDFFGKCTEYVYSGLAKKIQNNLVTVTPMTIDELTQAVTRPADAVGLTVSPALLTQMLIDVQNSMISLPLLQFTLTELWKYWHERWQEAKRESLPLPLEETQLTFSDYKLLGGIEGTLERRADEEYELLDDDERDIAKLIFLELTQLGEYTEDTRRQLPMDILVERIESMAGSEESIRKVIQALASAKLLVTHEERQTAVVDIAHEFLISSWSKFKDWIKENREELKTKRRIESEALEWVRQGKPKEPAFLLQGRKLIEAEKYFFQLPKSTQYFIKVSRKVQNLINQRNAQLKQDLQRLVNVERQEKEKLMKIISSMTEQASRPTKYDSGSVRIRGYAATKQALQKEGMPRSKYGESRKDIEKLVSSLREKSQSLPGEQKEEALDALDSLETEVLQPQAEEKKIGLRLKRLISIASTAASIVGGAAVLSGTVDDFVSNVIQLSETLDES